ncbi:MAG: hypothetical protein QXN77_08010 [Candidatus Caldarchaeum sp.]
MEYELVNKCMEIGMAFIQLEMKLLAGGLAGDARMAQFRKVGGI